MPTPGVGKTAAPPLPHCINFEFYDATPDAGLKDAITLHEQTGDNAPLQAYDYRHIKHSFAYPLRFELSRSFKSDFTSPRLIK
jgi:hypothetical protein